LEPHSVSRRINWTFDGGWGGQEVRTVKEMLALRERGHTVEVVCPRGAKIGVRPAELGFAVHHANMRGGGDIRSMMSIQALLRRCAFDVLNTHSGHDSLVAGTAGRLVGTPLVVRTRHLALPISSLATYTWISHRVIAVSHYVRRYLISAGVSAGRVETIYDGIVKPEPVARSTLRAELGLGPDAVIGCMRAKKGHVLRGCAPFLLPTHQEALGQSYIEAMAAGLPVIGTDVDGVPELIGNNVNGLLLPPKNSDALRAATVQLIDNPGLRTQLGNEGRRISENRFGIDNMADETIDLYRRICADGTSAHEGPRACCSLLDVSPAYPGFAAYLVTETERG
jgi:glycosyltransferase involved in cell wall biosynthesis